MASITATMAMKEQNRVKGSSSTISTNSSTSNHHRPSPAEQSPMFRQIKRLTTAEASSFHKDMVAMKYEQESKLDYGKEDTHNQDGPAVTTSETPKNESMTLLSESLSRSLSELHQPHQKRLWETYCELVNESTSDTKTTSPRRNDWVLISGPRGSGKTRLVQHLQQQAQEHGGIVLSGKFNVLNHDSVPYSAFVAAFAQYYARQRDNHLATEEFNDLATVMPALEETRGESKQQQNTPTCRNCDAAVAVTNIHAFQDLVCRFLKAISEHQPILFVLEDLQWADPCSIDLLLALLEDAPNRSKFVLLGTCEDISNAESYWTQHATQLQTNTRLLVELQNLTRQGVQEWIQRGLHLKDTELQQVLWDKTHGNVFYILHLVAWMHETNALVWDQTKWHWNGNSKNSCETTCCQDIIRHSLQRLPPKCNHILKVVACLGSVTLSLLEVVLKDYPVRECLNVALKRSLLTCSQEAGQFAFSHEQKRETVYTMIPLEERPHFHLTLGRQLWKRLSHRDLERHVFTVLSQFRSPGVVDLLTDVRERYALATLCLHAGQRAALSSTFRTAASYLDFGIDLISPTENDDCWTRDYPLALALYNAAAEMDVVCAHYDRFDQRLNAVLSHAHSLQDKLQMYSTQILALGMRHQQQAAIDKGIEVLTKLGVHLPSRLCKAHLLQEFYRVKRLLRGKSDHMILRMKYMEDTNSLAAMQILLVMFLNSVMVRPKFAPFVSLRMVQLTLQHGLSAFSSTGFGAYAMIYAGHLGDVDSAFRFGQISLKLLDKFQSKQYLPRVYAAVYGCIHHWRRPLVESLEPLLQAHEVALQTGDFEFAALNANLYCFNCFDAGMPLPTLEKESRKFCDLMKDQKQESGLIMGQMFLQMIHNLMGRTEDPLAIRGEILDYEQALQHAEETRNPSNAASIHGGRMTLAYLFGEYHLAADMAADAELDAWSPPNFEVCSCAFWNGMVSLEMLRQGIQKRKHRRRAKYFIKRMKKWSKVSPHNCLDKLFLLEAELASCQGKDRKAYMKYICAISTAKNAGFTLYYALANERAGRHLYRTGEVDLAVPALNQACSAYEEWGATAKVDHLRSELDSMYPSY